MSDKGWPLDVDVFVHPIPMTREAALGQRNSIPPAQSFINECAERRPRDLQLELHIYQCPQSARLLAPRDGSKGVVSGHCI